MTDVSAGKWSTMFWDRLVWALPGNQVLKGARSKHEHAGRAEINNSGPCIGLIYEI